FINIEYDIYDVNDMKEFQDKKMRMMIGGKSMAKGYVTQVMGQVNDVKFADNELPNIYDALQIEIKETAQTEARTLALEVSLHLGDSSVRAIAMSGTDGVQRGMEVVATGSPISVPVGDATLGRVFNVLGDPIDEAGDMAADTTFDPIHRETPS